MHPRDNASRIFAAIISHYRALSLGMSRWQASRASRHAARRGSETDRQPTGSYREWALTHKSRIVVAAVGLLLVVLVGHGLTSHAEDGESNAAAPDSTLPRAVVSFCATDHCGHWVIYGSYGEGHMKNTDETQLKVSAFGTDKIALVATTKTGPTAGRVVTYEGARKGNHIEGTATATWEGHGTQAQVKWVGDIATTSADAAWRIVPSLARGTDIYSMIYFLYVGAVDKDPRAITALGALYTEGSGFPGDYSRGARLFKSAANLGEKHAADFLGFMYDRGLGVPKDPAESAAWYAKAGVDHLVVPNLATAANGSLDYVIAYIAWPYFKQEANCNRSAACLQSRQQDLNSENMDRALRGLPPVDPAHPF
jgi:hypothetical protein